MRRIFNIDLSKWIEKKLIRLEFDSNLITLIEMEKELEEKEFAKN